MLKGLIIFTLFAVAVIITVNRDFGKEENLHQKNLSRKAATASCILIGLVIGCYDGLVGPGTGTFLIMAFTLVLGMDLLTASGCAKVGNLASNLASAAIWIANKQVYFKVALPAAACCIIGNWLGARYAIRGGSKKIRSMIFIVLGLLCVRLIHDLLS